MVTAQFTRWNGVPPDARQAGFEKDLEVLYLARVTYQGGVHLGKYHPRWSMAAISYGGREVWVADYEVWTQRLSDGSAGYWRGVGRDPRDAIVCGHEADGRPLYAARAYHNDGLHLGKWRPGWKLASIPYCGQELWLPGFEILTPGTELEGDHAFTRQHDG